MEHSLQDIVDALPYPAFFVGEDFVISHVNASAGELFEQRLKGQIFARILRQPEALGCLKDAIETQQLQSCDLMLTIARSRAFQGSAAPIGSNILFTLLDISAELDAEKARSTFVANVSHELRSPLTALSGVVETLQGPARNDEQARDRFLGLMQGETERMSRLVGDLLSLSKLEAKEHVLPVDQVDLIATIRRVIAVLSESTPIYKGRVEFSVPEGDCLITGDRDELTEVFQNLIENALKYSPSSSQVHVDILFKPNASSDVTVRVKDQGDGIAKEHLPRLTERFYRVDKGRSRAIGGTGLGLAIVKHILSRHRARLAIDSTLGEGTEVRATFSAKS